MNNDQPSVAPPTLNPVLDRIARVYATLSRAERQVADYVLHNPFAFTRTSIRTITATCGASAPTILRFCRAVGFSGLTDLKLSMVAVLGDTSSHTWTAPPPSSSSNDLLDAASVLIDGLRQQLHGAQLRDAMDLLAGAPVVTCMACHHLLYAAAYARDRLLRCGMHALTPDSPAYAGAPDAAVAAAVVGLFFCMGTPDAALSDTITRYRRYGKGAIVISNVTTAPFAQASVQILVGPALLSNTATSSSVHLLPHLLMTDLLVNGASQKRGNAALVAQ